MAVPQPEGVAAPLNAPPPAAARQDPADVWRGRAVIVFRPGALGDALLTLPVLTELARRGARVTTLVGTPASLGFVPRPATADGVAGGNAVDCSAPEVGDFGARDWLGLFGGSFSDGTRRCLAGADTAILFLQADGRGKAAAAALLAASMARVILAPPPLPEAQGPPHAAERLLQGVFGTADAPAIAAHGGDAAPRPPALLPPWFLPGAAEQAEATSIARGIGLDPMGAPPVFLHPGSGGARKALPTPVTLALLAQLRRAHRKVVLSQGPADGATFAALAEALAVAGLPSPPVLQQVKLRVLLALFSRGSVIAPDCGIAHLAATVAPLAVWFGPTDPACWRPLGPQVGVALDPQAAHTTARAEAAAARLIAALSP